MSVIKIVVPEKKNVYSWILPIFKLGCLFFLIELFELFIYDGYKPLTGHIICNYFPQ